MKAGKKTFLCCRVSWKTNRNIEKEKVAVMIKESGRGAQSSLGEKVSQSKACDSHDVGLSSEEKKPTPFKGETATKGEDDVGGGGRRRSGVGRIRRKE